MSLYGISKILMILNPSLHIIDLFDIIVQASASTLGIGIDIPYYLYEIIIMKMAGLFILTSAIFVKFKIFNHFKNFKM